MWGDDILEVRHKEERAKVQEIIQSSTWDQPLTVIFYPIQLLLNVETRHSD